MTVPGSRCLGPLCSTVYPLSCCQPWAGGRKLFLRATKQGPSPRLPDGNDMSEPLDAVGAFVDVLGGVTRRSNPVIDSYYKAAVAGLRQVAISLLTSTVNVATWLHRFRDFDF